MWLSCKAILHGYLAFRVNGETFLLYASARAKREWFSLQEKPYVFEGWHPVKGWQVFSFSSGRQL